MQIPGGIKQYRAWGQRIPIPAEAGICPFCPQAHSLHRHGCYFRTAVTEDEAHRIPIARLLCNAAGRTVSLLPDFLVPRKQHTTFVIATFLHAFVWLGASLAAAVSAATRLYPARQKGRFWCASVLARAATIRAYLADLAPPPNRLRVLAQDTPLRRSLRALLDPLRGGWDALPPAFLHHSRRMHARFARALA